MRVSSMGKIVHLTEVQFREYIKYSILKENFEGEGIYFNKQGVAMYDPNRTRWQAMDTKLTDGSGNVTPVITYLPKTHVMAINLYSQLKPKITKMLKHGTDIDGNPIEIDKSMDMFYRKISMFLTNIIRKTMPDVDYILIPKSSSDFNVKIVNELQRHLGGVGYQYFIPDAFVKNIQSITVDYDYLRRITNDKDKLTDKEIVALERTISKWKMIDEPIRGFRRNIEKLEKEIADLKNLKYQTNGNKRGRPSTEITDRQKEIEADKQAIFALRHGSSGVKTRGKDSTVDSNGKVKEWQIKSLEDRIRKAIRGFMQLNLTPNKNGYIRDWNKKLGGKKVIIFDDNISSGATMDDCCAALQRVGVNLKDILVLTLGTMDPTTYVKSDRTDSRIEP